MVDEKLKNANREFAASNKVDELTRTDSIDTDTGQSNHEMKVRGKKKTHVLRFSKRLIRRKNR